jgi:cytochrome b6-f complex iron-sulfur subunit
VGFGKKAPNLEPSSHFAHAKSEAIRVNESRNREGDKIMPDENADEITSRNGAELDRRRFFIKLGASSLAVAGAGAAAFAVQYLSPNVLYEASPVVSVGRPEHYPLDSVTLDPQFGIFIVRSAQGFYGLSAVCSHLGCLCVWKQDSGIIGCPCHGSAFQRDGSIIAGPAPKPLPWLRMWMTDNGELMVDRATKIAPNKEYVRV